MPSKRVSVLFAVLSLSLAACGCFGGGDDTASKKRFGILKKKDVASRNGRGKKSRGKKSKDNFDVDEMSPESSMERDLQRLQAREQAQVKKIKAMKNDLDTGSEMVMREEEKLRDIRGRINSYDTAMQRYEMASRARPSRADYGDSAVVPASQFQDRPVRNAQVAYGAAPRQSHNANYSTPSQQPAVAQRRSSRSARRNQPMINEGETLIYAPSPEEQAVYSAMAAPAPSPYRDRGASPAYDAPMTSAPSGRYDANPNPFSAPPGREAPASMPQGAAPEAERNWTPTNSLFSQHAASEKRFPDPAQYQVKRQDSFLPAPPQTPPSRTYVSPQATTRPEPQARAPGPGNAAPAGNEEMFMPDMFLSGGS